MRLVAGKLVCETIEELVRPDKTALVVVDAQNDFLAHAGTDGRRDDFNEARSRGIVPRIAGAIDAARKRHIPVIYLRYSRRADHRYESPASLRWLLAKRGYSVDTRSTIEGTWGWEILDALRPRESDVIIDKRRASGFFGTSLDALLRTRGVESVVLAGVSTHGCVEATARDAEHRDYYVVVLEDCVGAYEQSLHEAALVIMRSRFEVIGSAQLLRSWRVLDQAL